MLAVIFFCSHAAVPAFDAAELLPGGDGSVAIVLRASYMQPASNLDRLAKPDFYAGKALAKQPWVKAPSATFSRDGLGPLFNARSCLACHVNGGRGEVPLQDGKPLFSALVRLSLPGEDKTKGVIEEPNYGSQFQPQSTSLASQLGSVIKELTPEVNDPPDEGDVAVTWNKKTFLYPDGEAVILRFPVIKFSNLAYGAMHGDSLSSLRNAPALHGMGLLEAIAEQDILRQQDELDKDGNGVSGRANQVWDVARASTVLGRFGWKAAQPTVRQQTAAAFMNDVGISSSVFPSQPCTQAQAACLDEKHGEEWDKHSDMYVELPDNMLALATQFTRDLGVPKREAKVDKALLRGRALFYQSACQECHTPSYITENVPTAPHLSRQKIWPYTDLLLHDMGEDLADGRPDFKASGAEWRTAPLWGIGLSKQVNGNAQLLHDGRAQNIEEAILWHGGEAQRSHDYFINLSTSQREALISFVKTL